MSSKESVRRSAAGAVRLVCAVLALIVGSAGAATDETTEKAPKPEKATGSVEVILPGGNSPGGEKTALVEFDWFEATAERSARGQVTVTMLGDDGEPRRVITASVTGDLKTGVVVDTDSSKAWFVGEVVSDVKLHAACDGHDDGTTHDDGGCSGHDDGSTDGGCSGHDDGTTHDDGGCSGHDDGSTDGGCAGHDDGTTHDDGGCSGSSGGSGGAHVSGKDSRVGQLIVVKIHDGGTPGTSFDGITWKWYSSTDAPGIEGIESWPHLCKKPIVGGNLTVH